MHDYYMSGSYNYISGMQTVFIIIVIGHVTLAAIIGTTIQDPGDFNSFATATHLKIGNPYRWNLSVPV